MSAYTVVPAVIPNSFEHLREAFLSVQSVAREIQVDIVDGQFVPFTSWPYLGSGAVMLLREFTHDHVIEVDLMIKEPERALFRYLEAGVKKVVVHLEGVTDLESIRTEVDSAGCALGLSILNDTPLPVLTDVLREGDYVQLMGIKDIGSQGQPFDERVLDRVTTLRQMYPALTISIDGSVNHETLPRLMHAGANRFVSGSAIMKSEDPVRAYEALTLL